MSGPNDQVDGSFEQFLRRAHGRRVAWSLIENAGLCGAVAAGTGILFGVIMLSRGEASLQLSLGLLAASVPAGLWLGWTRRPSMFDTASQIDKQFQLDDLLGTVFVTKHSKDPWAITLRSIANAACANRSAGDLFFRHYGGRAWGGIGLSMALALAVGAMGSDPTRSVAADARAEKFDQTASSATAARIEPTAGASARPSVRDRLDQETNSSGRTDMTAEHSASAIKQAGDHAVSPSNDSSSAGAGSTRTNSEDDRRSAPDVSLSLAADAENGARELASGDGTRATNTQSADGAAPASVVITTDRKRFDAASFGSTRSRSSSNNGSFVSPADHAAPAQYRDLERGYFSND